MHMSIMISPAVAENKRQADTVNCEVDEHSHENDREVTKGGSVHRYLISQLEVAPSKVLKWTQG